METRDITAFMEESETPKTRAFDHALDIEFLILEEMDKDNVSKKELAARMGISPQNLSKLLNTQPNMTLETIARFELALGFELEISVKKDEQTGVAFHASYANHNEQVELPIKTEDKVTRTAIVSFSEPRFVEKAAAKQSRYDLKVAA